MTIGRRRAGVLIPLFSCPSTTSWGIGDIADIAPVCRWLAGAGASVLQLLPINEMAPGQQSPYSAISAMAVDPIFISLPAVEDFEAIGGEASMLADDRAALDAVRTSARIDYMSVRRLKRAALGASFARFVDAEWKRDSERARDFRMFVTQQAWWIEDYSLFRAIHAREGERPWSEWPIDLQDREPAAIDRARRELAQDVLFYQYLQWLASTQWRAARRHARGAALDVALFGDLPFMVDGDSADVWSRQQQFDLDVSIGAPPDAFTADGQDWGMPLYRWDVIEREDFRWLRERARRSADLFDGFRVDHLVGLYRTYGKPRNGGPAGFSPVDESSQLALGERVLRVFSANAEIVAEDLGTVPDFVRASLARLGIPGFRVLRWERYWHQDGQPFRDPVDYPPASVATSGTHDTEPLLTWWEGASADDRRLVAELPTIQRIVGPLGIDLASAPPDSARDVLLQALFAAKSNLLILPVQDVFGWRDRINEPATIDDRNWSFRLPWPSDRLDEIPEAKERQATLRGWSEQHARRPTFNAEHAEHAENNLALRAPRALR
ncbi:MAG TPA: 4-alpha-glucanotransferase [Vicinamibacterales bacterium]|nr:4-alpha-glucanotransferase [Vicinamibacterales bacterium]